MNLIREQRYLLAKRMEVLSTKLKCETDSIRAEEILQEMRNILALLKELAITSKQEESRVCQQNVF